MSEIGLTREFDARVWAKEFMRLYNENHQADVGEWIDEDLMITWFANAIMAGHDVAIDRLKDLILSGRPKKKEVGEMRHGGCNPDYDRGWNDAIDDYRLWLTKRLDGLGMVLLENIGWFIQEWERRPKSGKGSDRSDLMKKLANAIKQHLTKEE